MQNGTPRPLVLDLERLGSGAPQRELPDSGHLPGHRNRDRERLRSEHWRSARRGVTEVLQGLGPGEPRELRANGAESIQPQGAPRAGAARQQLLLTLLLLLCAGCAQRLATPRPAPLPEAALERFAQAQRLLASESIGPDLEAARVELQGAIAAAPDWLAPQRQLDDLDRRLLLGPNAYQRRLEAHHAAPFSGAALYLLGRLEGGNGAERFAEAAERDRKLAWAQHGLSVEAELAGERVEAHLLARFALSLARGDHELAFFGRRAAQLAPVPAIARRELEAVLLLAQEPWGAELAGLQADLAVLELRAEGDAPAERVQRERGLQRALRVLREQRLLPDEIRRLVLVAGSQPAGRSLAGTRFELRQALLDGPNLQPLGAAVTGSNSSDNSGFSWGPLNDVERFLAAANGDPVVGLGRINPGADLGPAESTAGSAAASEDPVELPSELPATWRSDLLSELANGVAPASLELWLASLPRAVKSADGLPEWPALARLVQLLRAWGQAPPSEPADWDRAAPELAQAFLGMGWSDSARGLIGLWRAHSPATGSAAQALAARLEAQALAQEAFLGELESMVTSLHRGQRSFSLEPLQSAEAELDPATKPPAPATESTATETRANQGRGLQAVLDAAGRLAQRYGPSLGWPAEAAQRISATARIDYGGLAQVTIPSPRFCQRDEQLGHGTAGATVAGLPEYLAAMGRVGLFGKQLGGRTDGTVLRLVGVEERSGEHLGVTFNGLVLYCDGADADGARSQGGGNVAGAALHEGYWIDLEVERRRLAQWHDLARRWFTPAAQTARLAALQQNGLDLRTRAASHDILRLLRRSGQAPLGEARRVALALLAERQAANPGGFPWLGLDELLTLVQTHEEGHLCDRTRYLPLSQHRGAAFALALSSGFDPRRIEQRLEYRAELTALAAAPEPRLALVEVLDALETHPAQRTVHGRAYANLAQDLLDALDRQLEADPAAFPGIDPERTLLHQMHRLSGAQVRRLALEVAQREGLLAP